MDRLGTTMPVSAGYPQGKNMQKWLLQALLESSTCIWTVPNSSSEANNTSRALSPTFWHSDTVLPSATSTQTSTDGLSWAKCAMLRDTERTPGTFLNAARTCS